MLSIEFDLNGWCLLQSDGTYMTESELIFAASRYENGQTLTCEAENIVLRDQNEKPLHERLKLEVLCE